MEEFVLLKNHIRFELFRILVRKRWLLPILLGFVLNLISADRLMLDLENTDYQHPLLFWDYIIYTFTDDAYIVFLFTPLWIYLSSDLMAPQEQENQMMIKLQSKGIWFIGKIGTHLLLSTLFVVIMAGMTLVFSLVLTETVLDEVGHYYQDHFLSQITGSIAPWNLFLLQFTLLILAYWFLSLFALTGLLLMTREIGGLIINVLVWIFIVIGFKMGTGMIIQPSANLLVFYSSYLISICYWIVLTMLLVVVNQHLIYKKDLLRRA